MTTLINLQAKKLISCINLSKKTFRLYGIMDYRLLADLIHLQQHESLQHLHERVSQQSSALQLHLHLLLVSALVTKILVFAVLSIMALPSLYQFY